MKLLAFDTSTESCVVSVISGEAIYTQHVQIIKQAKVILPMVQRLLQQASVSLDSLDAISFGCGPGSFTGLRVAASVAKALAFAVDCPLIMLSSLALLAQSAYAEYQCENMVVALDARMSEVYTGFYCINEGLVQLQGIETLVKPAELVLPATSMSCVGVGNAWAAYPEILVTDNLATIHNLQVSGDALIALSKQAFLQQNFTDIDAASPVYLRDKVAKTELERQVEQ